MTMTVGQTATLAHGFTMAQIDDFTRLAVRFYGRGHMLDAGDRWECAHFGIVELLYTSTDRPDRRDLINAGVKGIQDEIRATLHHRGIDVNTFEQGPHFTKFWITPHVRHGHDFTDTLVERLALPQVLGELTAKEYQAIAALALYGSQKDAAAALGIEPGAFTQRVQRARRRIATVWLEHETPRTQRTSKGDETCGAGHSRLEHGYKNEKGWWRCQVCVRNGQRRHRAKTR